MKSNNYKLVFVSPQDYVLYQGKKFLFWTIWRRVGSGFFVGNMSDPDLQNQREQEAREWAKRKIAELEEKNSYPKEVKL